MYTHIGLIGNNNNHRKFYAAFALCSSIVAIFMMRKLDNICTLDNNTNFRDVAQPAKSFLLRTRMPFQNNASPIVITTKIFNIAIRSAYLHSFH